MFKEYIKELITAYGRIIPYFKSSYATATSPFFYGSWNDIFVQTDENTTKKINTVATTPQATKELVSYLNSLQCWYKPNEENYSLNSLLTFSLQ